MGWRSRCQGERASRPFESEGGGNAGCRAAGESGRRRGCDRRDHVVHEHVESIGADRRGTSRPQRRRPRTQEQTLGQDSLAPGSQSVTDYLAKAGLQRALDALASTSSDTAGRRAYGNSAPSRPTSPTRSRNTTRSSRPCCRQSEFRRPHSSASAREYLASPRSSSAYALAGRMDVDLTTEPIGPAATERRLPQRHLADERRDRRNRDGMRETTPCSNRVNGPTFFKRMTTV